MHLHAGLGRYICELRITKGSLDYFSNNGLSSRNFPRIYLDLCNGVMEDLGVEFLYSRHWSHSLYSWIYFSAFKILRGWKCVEIEKSMQCINNAKTLIGLGWIRPVRYRKQRSTNLVKDTWHDIKDHEAWQTIKHCESRFWNWKRTALFQKTIIGCVQ